MPVVSDCVDRDGKSWDFKHLGKEEFQDGKEYWKWEFKSEGKNATGMRERITWTIYLPCEEFQQDDYTSALRKLEKLYY